MSVCPPTAQDEYELVDSEALHAATLALMTGHAQQPCPGQRSLMARKICSNLALLAGHPSLSAELRRVMQRLHGMWAGLGSAAHHADAALNRTLGDIASLPETRLWHAPAPSLQ